jgi:PTS system nitrogen regulatory IIA component
MDVNLNLLPEAVRLAPVKDKNDALSNAAELLAEAYGLQAHAILDGLEEREKLGSTGFGRGVAIPHCRSDQVNRPTVAVLRCDHAVDFGAADAIPVTLLFALVSPEKAGATHLHALAAISRLMRDEAIVQSLLEAPDAEAMFALLTNQFLRDAA